MLAKALLTLSVLPAALGCGPMKPRNPDSPNSYPIMDPGSDTPSDPATTGYFMNHISLNVNNLNRSMDFYSSVFGFRHIFTMYLTPQLSFTYMGHSQGGRNSTGYQTAAEMLRFKNNAAGYLEMVHLAVDGEENHIDGPDQGNATTLSHLGIIVPDTAGVVERLEKYGATIYKKPGEPMPTEGPLGNPYSLGDADGLSDEDWKTIQASMGELNQLNTFAADPDGNLLEIQPIDEGGLFD